MFSNTAYEALYEYIGLALHSNFVEILTSQRVFMATILLLFGVMFFVTSVQFFSRYIPGTLLKRRSVPLSKFVRVIFCLFLGMSLLKIGATTGVKRFNGESWHANAYVKSKGQNPKAEYQVSFVFDILSRTAEELAAFLTRTVDTLFKTQHSDLDAPDFFYKAILYAGSSTLTDPDLRGAVDFYTDECIDRILPMAGSSQALDKLDGLFGRDQAIDQRLREMQINRPGLPGYNCYNAKEDVREKLQEHARATSGVMPSLINTYDHGGPAVLTDKTWENIQISSALVDHYLEDREGFSGIQKGSQPPSGAGRILQYVNRFFSWDTAVSIFGGRGNHGAALAAERAQEFSENLTRAPHIAGFIKLCLIAVFPWLIFPVVAGYWRVLLGWWLLYGSVLLWAPVWTLLYHIMVSISLSAEALSSLGRLSDGISLYSASLITSRMNYMYAVYSWVQLLVATVLTGGLLWIAKPLLSDSKSDGTPEFIGDAGRVAGVASKVGGMV